MTATKPHAAPVPNLDDLRGRANLVSGALCHLFETVEDDGLRSVLGLLYNEASEVAEDIRVLHEARISLNGEEL